MVACGEGSWQRWPVGSSRPSRRNERPGTSYILFVNKEGVTEKELRLGVRTRKFSRVRAKVSYHLSHEFGISRAEIARQLGVITSAIAKAIQNMEGEGNKC